MGARAALMLALLYLALSTTAIAAPLVSAHIAVSAAGIQTDSLASFGLDYAATDTFDPGIDLFAPPAPPGDWVIAYFDRPEWGQAWNRFMSDLRAPFTVDTESKQWRFTVQSSVATDITLRLNQIVTQPGYSVRLLDPDAGYAELVGDLLTGEYTFASPGGSRDFVIELECTGCVTGIDADDTPVVPGGFTLHSVFPNPFNASTLIHFVLTRPASIDLRVYNVLGRPVARLAEGYRPAGDYRVSWNAASAPSGVYFIRLMVGNEAAVTKAVLLK